MRGKAKISVCERVITSRQSGDCPVYSQEFIYIGAVYGPWSVCTINKTLLPIIKWCPE